MLETNVLGLLAGMPGGGRKRCGRAAQAGTSSTSRRSPRTDPTRASTARPSTQSTASRTRLRQELIEDPIQVVTIMPGAIATSFARNFDPAVINALASTAGVEPVEVIPGEQMPDEVLAAAQSSLPDHLCTPVDVADAVVFAVTRRPGTHIGEIVVRPNKDFDF